MSLIFWNRASKTKIRNQEAQLKIISLKKQRKERAKNNKLVEEDKIEKDIMSGIFSINEIRKIKEIRKKRD